MALLSNYKEWTLSSQLAVTDRLALNVDATNLSDGKWTGVTKHGDVVYDAGSRALVFNEDEENNPTGEGGYLEYLKNGLDFSKGFTFEMYGNLSRLRYKNALYSEYSCMGLFIKIPDLFTGEYSQALRMGAYTDTDICKLNRSSSWTGENEKMGSNSAGHILVKDGYGFSQDEDFYLTFVYRAYDHYSESERESLDWTEDADRVDYYINGEPYGYTYFGKDSYKEGLEAWNTDDSPFFVGACVWWLNGNVYYLKGKVYSCRLYERGLSKEEVKDNYNSTVQFRSSGL